MQNNDDEATGKGTRPDFSAITPEDRDFRGRYGYGRPAYKPDPEARYSFRPWGRQLPLRAQRGVFEPVTGPGVAAALPQAQEPIMPDNPIPLIDRAPATDRNRRERLGISVDDLAAKAGIAPEELVAYEQAKSEGEVNPTVAMKIGDALDMSERR